mmetsp:Transcript_31192/g.60182  ORF Transcript_31192/g.60182 Transcript_31192/m.60182 type:complete len:365 (-) Transcript_31192:130-1224(-)
MVSEEYIWKSTKHLVEKYPHALELSFAVYKGRYLSLNVGLSVMDARKQTSRFAGRPYDSTVTHAWCGSPSSSLELERGKLSQSISKPKSASINTRMSTSTDTDGNRALDAAASRTQINSGEDTEKQHARLPYTTGGLQVCHRSQHSRRASSLLVPRQLVSRPCASSALVMAQTTPGNDNNTKSNKTCRRSKRAVALAPPPIMRFHTMWFEERQAVHMRMDFDTGTKTWEVCVDTPLRVTTSGVDGRPLTELDLHVGARVHVLGRWVTLRQATRATAEWIDARARQLIDKKLKLEHQLAQFTYVADAASHKNRKYHQAVGHKYVAIGGEINLRALKNEVVELQQALRGFKPKKGSRPTAWTDEKC